MTDEAGTAREQKPWDLVIDANAPEIRAVQLLIDNKPEAAKLVIDGMSGKDRAVLYYYIRELEYMIDRADSRDRIELQGGVTE